MNSTNVSFNAKRWLVEALSDDQTPLTVDSFEAGQALREIRLDISRETDPKKRAARMAKLYGETVQDADFARLIGKDALVPFEDLFSNPEAALLYKPSSSLDTPSKIRDSLLAMLAGVPFDLSPRDAAKEIAKKVPNKESTLALEQVKDTLASLDTALARLPEEMPMRTVEGTTSEETARDFRSILVQLRARLRQPKAAAAMDELFTMKFRPSSFATLKDTGVSQADFNALSKLTRKVVKSGALWAATDIAVLWTAAKAEEGAKIDYHDAANGFGAIKYSGRPAGAGFQKDVKKLEDFLQMHTTLRAGTRSPAG